MIKRILFFVLILLTFSCHDKVKESRILLNEGVKLMYASQHVEALEKIDEAIAIKPDFAEAYHKRAMVNFAMKNTELSLEDLNRAIELNPNFAEAYKSRAQIKFSINDKDGACLDYIKASELGIPNLRDFTKNCR